MTKSKTKPKKHIPKIVPLSYATFSLYDPDSIYGSHGPVRYYGDCEYKSRVPQRWRVEMTLNITNGVVNDALDFIFTSESKIMIGELGSNVNSSIQKELHKANEEADIPFRFCNGFATCYVVSPK